MKKKISLISPEIKEILNLPNKEEKLKELFYDMHPHDIFILVEGLERDPITQIITALGIPKGVELFEEFRISDKKRIFAHFTKDYMADVLEEMSPDERVDFIKDLPKDMIENVLPLVAQAERNDIKKLLQYKEGTAGSILTTEYASLPPNINVREALVKLKLQAFDRETIYYVYVIDQGRRLLGFVSLKDILVAKSDDLIQDIMHTNVISVNVNEDKEIVAKKLFDYDFLAIPVINGENKLVGIVTVDDVVDIMAEEDTEDMLHYGAAGRYIDYMGSGPFHIARQRILWLLVLVAVGFLSGWIMERYAFQLQAVIALAFFIPLLMDAGGNAGTQSSTVIIRGLATGEVKMKDLLRVFKKEFFTGLLIGITMGVLATARALIMQRDPLLGVTVGVAMVATVMLATSLGAILPLLFKKLRLDPAVMSAPFITTIIDVVSIFLYLRIAVLVFR